MAVLEKVTYRGKVFTRSSSNSKNKSKQNYFFGFVYDRRIKRSRKISLHRFVWESNNGPIPSGNIIHHIDGNPLNNDISNLAAIPERDHLSKYHGEGKYKNAKEKICERCGSTFKAKTKRSRFCRECADIMVHSSKEYRKWKVPQ